jgi:transposase
VLEFFANLPGCVIGLEACAGAHYWARELIKLGHEVRLMPPQYVRLTSRPTSTMPRTPRPAARPCSGQACGSCRSSTSSSRRS